MGTPALMYNERGHFIAQNEKTVEKKIALEYDGST